jgi:two-component sensor histidine kinase
VLVAVIPIIVIALYFAFFYQRAYINEKATQITNLCEGFTNEQRLIVRNAEETLLAISQTRAVQDRDYGVLNAYLQDLMKVYPDYAVLLVADSSGTVIASGINKTGYTIADRSYFRYAMQTGRFTPGQYIVSRSTGEDVVTFTLPARTRSGEMVYLICSFNLEKYSRELSLDRLPEGATLEIFDYFGLRLFSNSSDEHDDPGSRVSEALFMHALLSSGSAAEKVSLSGIPYLASMGVVCENGLSIHISVRMPYDRILSKSYTPAIRIFLFMLLSCLAAFGLSLWLARRLFVGRIERLTTYTRALADGNLSIRSEINSSRDEVTDLIESFNKMASALEERDRSNERTLAEKELLLLELQKRVSDNLQLLSSLVNLQVGHASDEAVRHALTTTHSRVMALALVYETIYRYSDVQRVQMHRYCVGLCEYLASLYSDVGSMVTSSVSGIDVALPIEKALPLALILNELVSNSLLHAFPNNAQGTIRIAFERESPVLLTLTLSDDGVGFEDDVRRKGTFGYEMVEALVEQLHGSLTLRSGPNGSEITVRFPDER